MLEQILDSIHNYFEKEIVSGDFTISSGSLQLPFLSEGQYFRIVGSTFNDGVYMYPANTLHDESFNGQIWAMAVPPSVIALSRDVSEWVGKYGNAVNSPYQSESFGGYSYTKAQGHGQSGLVSWRSMFADRLNRWRKIS